MRHRHTLVASLLIVPVLACAPAGPTPEEIARQSAESEAAAAAIRTAGDEWTVAFEAKDASALAAFSSADAILLPPHMPVVTGSEAIVARNEESFAQMELVDATLTTDELEVSGDLAYRRGSCQMTAKAGEAEVAATGKFIEIWKGQADGTWKITHGIGSDDATAPGE